MATLKIKPSSYTTNKWKNIEKMYDNDTSTYASCTVNLTTNDLSCDLHITKPSLPDYYIINNIKLHLVARGKTMTNDGGHWLRIYINETNQISDLHLGFCDGIEYDIPLTIDQYNQMNENNSMKLTAHRANSRTNINIHIFDFYIEIDYTDLSQTMITDTNDDIWIYKKEITTININAYPKTLINWSVDNPNIIDLQPTSNGFSCNIIGKAVGECIITATHSENSECKTQFKINVNKLIENNYCSFILNNVTLNHIMIGEQNVAFVYLGSTKVFEYKTHIPYNEFKFNTLTKDFTMPLYTRLTSQTYMKAYIDRLDGHIRNYAAAPPGELEEDNSSIATVDYIPVYDNEEIIFNYPSTEYGIGLCSYTGIHEYYKTWFGPDKGWGNYNMSDSGGDVTGTTTTCIIPEGAKYIRWCGNDMTGEQIFARRYSVQNIDLIPYPPNSTYTFNTEYKSSDESVAVIEGSMIRAKSAGNCIITVTHGQISTNINLTIIDNSNDFTTY